MSDRGAEFAAIALANAEECGRLELQIRTMRERAIKIAKRWLYGPEYERPLQLSQQMRHEIAEEIIQALKDEL